MKMMSHALLVALAVFVAPLALAQDKKAPEPIAEAAVEVQQGEEGADESAPEPTPAVRSFPCAVDAAGERCTVPITEGNTVDGVVAYKQEHTGKWIDFGWGPFNAEGVPHGCDWVLSFRERLVEESGCFEAGKRHGTWETCRLRLNQPNGGAPNLKCPKTEYEMGVIVVKAPEPEPELIEEDGEPQELEEGEKPATDKSPDDEPKA